ncbi:MAG: 50S ribosomal protein L9 [Patescibacteria group bacterium]
MKVVLTADIKNIGQKGDEKEVKPGFARNFLFPKNLAIAFDSADAQALKSSKESEELKSRSESDKIRSIIAKSDNLTLSFKSKASKEGKLFGSISSKEIISQAEKKLGLKIASIEPSEAIKVTGDHIITLIFKTGDQLQVKVNVTAETKARK